MRRGELLALRWRDIDLDGLVLRVERSLEQTKAGLSFKSSKTRHGRRSISLPASAVAELREHWKTHQQDRLRLGMGRATPDMLVFPAWEGKPRSPNALTKEWPVAVRTAEVPLVTLHSLRRGMPRI
jgi:integrase